MHAATNEMALELEVGDIVTLWRGLGAARSCGT